MDIIKSDPSIDSLMRQTRSHHVQLSAMADAKANMLMTIAAVVITLLVPHIVKPYLKWSAFILIGFCLLTIILAAYSSMPKLSISGKRVPKPSSPGFNLLFFGDFVNMDYADYESAMEAVINDPSRTYQVQVQEIFFMGRFLARKKYHFLRLAYLSFILGLFISGIVMLFYFITQ